MAEAKTGANGGSGGGTPRWLWGVLLVSLMANMVVVGVTAGRMWAHHQGGPGWHRHERGGGMRAFLKSLPEARRQELGALVKANREALRSERKSIRALRRAVRAEIAREPFDRAALEDALSKVSGARQTMRARTTSDFVELVARMTPQERKVFAERGLKRRGRRGEQDSDM